MQYGTVQQALAILERNVNTLSQMMTRLTFDYLNTPHFLQFSYTAGFFTYSDCSDKNVLNPGSLEKPGLISLQIKILVNPMLMTPGQ